MPTYNSSLDATQAAAAVSQSQRDIKDSVRAVTTQALPACTYANGTLGVGATLTANANGALPAQDGIALVVGNRLGVKNQANPAHNGLFKVTAAGDVGSRWALIRTTDADESAEVTPLMLFGVEEGSAANVGAYYELLPSANPVVVGTTNLVFSVWSSHAGRTSAATNAGAPDAAKIVVLDGDGKLAGRVIENDGPALDAVVVESAGTVITSTRANLALFANDGVANVLTYATSDPANLPPPYDVPTQNDAHLVVTPGAGDWAGHNEEIATWNGAAWVFTPVAFGDVTIIESTDAMIRFNGTSWIDVFKRSATADGTAPGAVALLDSAGLLDLRSTLGILNAQEGLNVKQVARVVYDFAADGGAQGTINLGAVIPSGCFATRSYYQIVTELTSGGAATVGLRYQTTAGPAYAEIVADSLLGDPAWLAGGFKEGTQLGTAATFGAAVQGAVGNIQMVIGVADLTAGKFALFVEYQRGTTP